MQVQNEKNRFQNPQCTCMLPFNWASSNQHNFHFSCPRCSTGWPCKFLSPPRVVSMPQEGSPCSTWRCIIPSGHHPQFLLSSQVAITHNSYCHVKFPFILHQIHINFRCSRLWFWGCKSLQLYPGCDRWSRLDKKLWINWYIYDRTKLWSHIWEENVWFVLSRGTR
jgi:hypothetical protein